MVISQGLERLQLDTSELESQISAGQTPLTAFRDALKENATRLDELFWANQPIIELVHARALFVDSLLDKAWRLFLSGEEADIALLAAGGYGRGELHPSSDIDLMILLAEATHQHDESWNSSCASCGISAWKSVIVFAHSMNV